MAVEILRVERCGNGWLRVLGAVNGCARVNGMTIGVRVPLSGREQMRDADMKEALLDEYERLSRIGTIHEDGGAYAR
jgi:hypothetical protein